MKARTMTTSPSGTLQPPRRSWWSQNWKWITAGCALLAFLPLAILGIIALVLSGMRNSDVCRLAMAYVRQDEVVLQKLGSPIEQGWLMSGTMQTSGGSGTADLSLPISGPKGKGKLYLTAEKRAGEWKFSTLVLRIEGETEAIDLLRDQSRGT